MATQPSKTLEVVPNQHPDRDYEVSMVVPEFTCLCPVTGHPDFATVRIRYVPDQHLVELKSLKLYLWSFRNEGHFHEAVTNRIVSDLVKTLRPRFLEVAGDFFVRGGIHTVVTATHRGKRGRS
jgi:7-cyano-7-deazaguanine reductase